MTPFPAAAARRLVPMLGWRRRRKTNSSMVSDFIALRRSLMLCGSCENAMPLRWCARYVYRKLPRFHGHGRCDRCRVEAPGNLFLPEEDSYMTNWVDNERVVNNARNQQLARLSGKRIEIAS